ncbi:SDR family NAD(P)-dependent oxidoreductase [Actinopolymorpha pittospori]|uniref:3-oxoacyl-[acyl-carrier protein] reductase n=1 Tax=Actinopolymorpha pittospori TaxID=648752 RepID=A0A927MM17_9ACTN|nr:SDR family NAD(P)-dependent oxidoreductase [Actinopolymorpha pittospori]MBE1603155.1 3-oxoacyl-[acyl-carrier protein] reductase [Actinopolymorpha pittospori]
MQIDLSGKTAIVTGGGRGIGRDLVLRLAAEGVQTVALDVNQDDLDSLQAELASSPVASLQLRCDVTDSAQITEVVEQVRQRFGRIDILVNNAGVTATGPIDTLPEEAWRRCHEVNLTAVFLMCKAVVPVMKHQGFGRILNASSFAAIVPSVAHAAYASSKAAVAHFTRALAGEVGPWNITVNAYAPGMVPTTLNHFTERPQEEQDRLLNTLTLRRWGSTEDIGNLLCFLASDQASYITGTLIDVSGGKLATQVPSVAYEFAAAGDESTII